MATTHYPEDGYVYGTLWLKTLSRILFCHNGRKDTMMALGIVQLGNDLSGQ